MILTQNVSGVPRLSEAELVQRLEEAGSTLLALPDRGPSTRLVQTNMIWLNDAAGQAHQRRLRPPVPSAADITRMDEALGWIVLIPVENYVLRRVVGARCLVHPMTARHLFSWRRLARAVGADHKAVQRWHAQGIAIIHARLVAPPLRAGRAATGAAASS